MRTFLMLTLFLAVVAVSPTHAQNMFKPRILIEDQAITAYEYDQRRRFMELLGVREKLDQQAEETLIEDRLRLIAAARLGLRPTPDGVRAGMTEFAARANLGVDEFIAALGQNGVDAETFRDFVTAGLLWREVVRQKFVGRAGTVSEADIDRALSIEATRGTVRVLLSEILLPSTEARKAADLATTLRGEAAFGRAAREVSKAASAPEGGRLDWVPVPNLPPALVAQLSQLQPGGVTRPITVPDGVAIYLLRAVETLEAITPRTTQVEYAQLLVPAAGTPAGDAEIARLRAGADRCNDLFKLVPGASEDQLSVKTQLLSAIPAEIATELARLDAGEASSRITRGGTTVFLMLCSRTVASDLPPSREAVRERIALERLEGHARIYLAELRANARIRRP